MMLNPKQVGQATFPLHQDASGRFSYAELIELVLGREKWLDVKREYGLKGKNMESQVHGAGFSSGGHIRLSARLRL